MASLPRLHEILWLPAPAEWACVVFIVMLDAALDRRDAFVDRVERRVHQTLPRGLWEEGFNGIHQRGRGRGETECPVGTGLQTFGDLSQLAGRDVVQDYVNLHVGPEPLGDVVEEGEEFLRAVTLDHPAGDLSGGDVESRQQAGGALDLQL